MIVSATATQTDPSERSRGQEVRPYPATYAGPHTPSDQTHLGTRYRFAQPKNPRMKRPAVNHRSADIMVYSPRGSSYLRHYETDQSSTMKPLVRTRKRNQQMGTTPMSAQIPDILDDTISSYVEYGARWDVDTACGRSRQGHRANTTMIEAMQA